MLTKIGVGYLVLCEALLVCWAALMSVGYFTNRSGLHGFAFGVVYLMIALLSVWSCVALLRRMPRAWLLSLLVGFTVLALVWYSIWFGITYANSHTDEGDAVLYGYALIVFALPAFIVLFLPATRSYLKR